MAITPINSSMAYTSPSFKAVPKLNNVTKMATTMAAPLKESEGFFKNLSKKWSEGYDNFVEKAIVQPILKPIMNSEAVGKLAESTKDVKNMAAHMSTAGSVVTTATYASTSLKTLKNDEEQKKRAKTLVLNQIMVTALSTLGAYTINDKLGKLSKNLGYKFREVNQGNPHLDRRMRGFNTAKSLLIFSVMYRYVAPVLVTPLASKIGNIYNNRQDQKAKEQQANTTITTAKK